MPPACPGVPSPTELSSSSGRARARAAFCRNALTASISASLQPVEIAAASRVPDGVGELPGRGGVVGSPFPDGSGEAGEALG